MGLEIERKFLVNGDFMKDAYKSYHITQGYICRGTGRSVRIRIRDDKAFITIKGKASESGLSRFEWEKPITVKDAMDLLELRDGALIDKTRYLVKVGDHVFEVDVFSGDNKGLVMAEVELGSEDEAFEKPQWLGEEVTGDRRYYNSSLIANPFKDW